MEPISAADIALSLVGGIGLLIIVAAIVIAILDRAHAAITQENGIDAFIKSFESEQFEDRRERRNHNGGNHVRRR